MPRPLRLLSFVLACVLLAAGGASAAPSMKVLSFDALIDIRDEDKILVTEEITAEVPTSNTNRGMFREIPINPRWRDKGRRNVSLKVLQVKIDGKEQRADDIVQEWPFLRIYVRDKNAYLSAGVHKFVIQYSMTQQIGYFDKQDELTWNVVGSGWAGGIARALCIVLPPPGTKFIDNRVWVGRRGSTDPADDSVSVISKEVQGRPALVFRARDGVRSGEDFTIAVAWPKGFCKGPSTLRPEDETGFTLSLAALFLFVLALSAFLWFKYGKDPKVGPVVPLFYPPKLPSFIKRTWAPDERGEIADGRRGWRLRRKSAETSFERDERLTAAAVGYLWNKNTLDSRGLAALFLSLAGRGDCVVHGGGKGEAIILEKVGAASPNPEEWAAEGKMPSVLNLGKNLGYCLSEIKEACARSLDADYKKKIAWYSNIGLIFAMFLPAIIGLLVLVRWNLGPIEDWPDVMFDLPAGFFFTALLCSIVGKLVYDLFTGKNLAKTLLKLILAVPIFGVIVFPLWDSFSLEEDLLWVFSPLQWLLMMAVTAVPCLFAPIMDAPSAEAAKLRQKIAGLAMYIGAAEADRLNFANPPDKPLELYHRLLPYAVALGLEKAWGERFADELKRAAGAETGLNLHERTVLLDSLITSTARSIASYEAAEARRRCASSRSSGSSFSSGGGGAGSGGGGGGGGAC